MSVSAPTHSAITLEQIVTTLLEAKMLIENLRRKYNALRHHSCLGYRTPARVYEDSLS
jgi:hypothetical protein